MNDKIKRSAVYVSIMLSSFLVAISSDIFAPSLPQLPDAFGTTIARVQASIAFSTFTFAAVTLLHGPLSERFGLRRVFLWAMVTFGIAAALAGLSRSIDAFIAAQVLEAIATSAQSVVTIAMILELFDEKKQVRMFALLGFIHAASPAIAPILGSYVLVWFGWQANFFLMSVMALSTAIFIWLYLDECGSVDKTALAPRRIVAEYLELLLNWTFVRLSILGGLIFAFAFAFLSTGPFILEEIYGLPPQAFGYLQIITVLAYAVGAFLTGKFIVTHSAESILRVAVVCALVGGSFLCFTIFSGLVSPLIIFVAISIIKLGEAGVFPTSTSLAMEAATTGSGPAAAMLSTLVGGFASLGPFFVSLLQSEVGMMYSLAGTSAILTVLLFFVFALKPRKDIPADRVPDGY